ncbi:hypothetical protein RU639_003473 [Aspergillus parasiticus]
MGSLPALGFISPVIGTRSLAKHFTALCDEQGPNLTLPELRRVVLLASDTVGGEHVGVREYATFTSNAHSGSMKDFMFKQIEQWVSVDDVLNPQFTLRTTCAPKAAMLMHM